MKGKELRISGTVMGQSARRWALRWVLVGVLVIMEPVSHAWPGGFDSFEQQQFDQLIVQCGADWPDVEPFNPCPNDRLAGLESPFGGDLIDSNPGDGKCEAIYTIAEGDVVIFIHTCTLRAAIMEANALGGGPHTIFLQAGQTYTLFRDADGGGHATDSGANNDDLDITSQITIQGNGATIERSTAVVCTRNGIAEGGEFRIFHVHGTGNLTLQDLTVRNGCADGAAGFPHPSGGGIFVASTGQLTLTNVTLMGNSSGGHGGGIYNLGTVTITNSTISGNSAGGFGGGIWNDGTLTITNSTISGNSTDYFGGGIYNFGGTVTITNSTISGNSAGGSGGGFGGGGITNKGTMTITKSTISGNTSTDYGGAIDNSGTLNLTNTTISGNSSGTSAGDAGGIYNYGTVNASFITIANNTSSTTGAGGIFNFYPGTINIKNSIIANNTDPNCYGTLYVYASGVNFATDGSCGSGFTQVISAQLNLQPLADNGGPTQTHALGAGSVAIDAVTDCTDLSSNTVNTDQRGVTRPQGSRCDAGAFEREAAGYRLHLPLVVR